jgi:hypothetical protein
MELTDVLTVAVSTLIVVVLSHLAVYWVVKTLYPPQPPVVLRETVYTPPVSTVQPLPPVEEPIQHVDLPTYEAPNTVASPPEERKGPPPAEATSIRGKPGVDAAESQPTGPS